MKALSFGSHGLCHPHEGLLIIALMSAACGAGDDASLGPNEDGIPSDTSEESVANMSIDLSRDKNLPTVHGEGFTLIEEINLPGRRVEFYETEDGGLFNIELGRLGAARKDPEEQGLAGSSLYEFLTHKKAPQRLVDAELRAGVNRQRAPSQAVESVDAHTKSHVNISECGLQGGCRANYTRADFVHHLCNRSGYANWTNLWVTSNTAISKSGVNEWQASVLSHVGTIRYEGRYNGGTVYKYFWMLIPANYYISWWRDSLINADAFSRVTEANPVLGEYYDHCVFYRT
jgi:hypothetical protein